MDTIKGLFTKRNAFDLSHERKLTCEMGKLVPILCEEILPGDTFQVSTDMLLRLAPMLAPVMHKVDAFIHYFFVPNRLVWDNWEKFITGDVQGNNASVAPTITTGDGGYAKGSLGDFLGIPTDVDHTKTSALFFRAYGKVFNDWYRDQNFQTEVVVSKADGADTTTNVDLLTRNWEKDYFTSSLPWAQRGTAVSLPLGTTAPVVFDVGPSVNEVRRVDNGTSLGALYTTSAGVEHATGVPGVDINSRIIDEEGWTEAHADLSTATAATINQLRQAFQVQKWMERNARAGVRYVESILAHFGVISSDARLQRSEFLGGGRSSIVISEVLQTSKTEATGTPLATMAGHGFSAQRSDGFRKSFEEHGILLGILSILPKTNYQQGLNRMWRRSSRYDYYWPEFANLGEQAVLMSEVYMTPFDGSGDDHNDVPWGYQGRYDEYRRRESSVHGEFRDSMKHYHMGRIFADEPVLGEDFIKADPTKRIFAVTEQSNPVCWIYLHNNVKAVRPLPLIGEPGLIDHN